MKKTLTINLGGVVFHIDEDAYEKMRQYLNRIEARFTNRLEAQEIMGDIESRAAELLQQRLRDLQQPIVVDDIEFVIKTLGAPDSFSDSEEPAASASSFEPRRNKRLYRDPDNSAIAGVCSGLAAYLNIDIALVRVLFVVFFFLTSGFTLLLYIILWIAVPQAFTTAQKLEMQGENVTIENIERKVREEFEAVKNNVNRFSKSGQVQSFFDKLLHILGVIIKAAAKIFANLIGVVFIILGIAALTAVLGLTVGFLPFDSGSLFEGLSIGSQNLIFRIALMITVIFPIVWILYAGIKLIFNLKVKDKPFKLSSVILWLICIVVVLVSVISRSKNFVQRENFSTKHEFAQLTSDTLRVELLPGPPVDQLEHVNFDDHQFGFWFNDESNRLAIKPDLRIRKSADNFFSLEIMISSRGQNRTDAENYARKIPVEFVQQNGKLQIKPFFELDHYYDWRVQEAELTLWVPEGKVIFLSPELNQYTIDIHRANAEMDFALTGNFLKMNNDGLVLSEEVKK